MYENFCLLFAFLVGSLPVSLMVNSRSHSENHSSESILSSSESIPVSGVEEHDVTSFAPGQIESKLGARDLNRIRIRYGVPSIFELEPLGPNGRVSNPPPGRMSLYEEAFKIGLRLPITLLSSRFSASSIFLYALLFQTPSASSSAF